MGTPTYNTYTAPYIYRGEYGERAPFSIKEIIIHKDVLVDYDLLDAEGRTFSIFATVDVWRGVCVVCGGPHDGC